SAVRYQLRTAGDTVDFADLSFASTVERNAAGNIEKIRYSSALPGSGARVMIDYSFVPNSHLVHVNGRLEGISGKSYLIVQLPSGLRSGEADSVEDQRHFAIAYRRT